MAQRKFLRPIVGGAIGLAILGVAGAVLAAGETALITATGTGSGTSTTAVVYTDSTLTCVADGSAESTTVTELGWYDDAAKTNPALQTVVTGSGASLSDTFSATLTKGDVVFCVPTYANSAVVWDSVTVANAAPSATGVSLTADGAGQTATCSWTFDDPDSTDTQSAATVNWYYVASGTAVSTGTLSKSSTVTTVDTDTINLDVDGSGTGVPSVSGGGSLLCEVIPTDDDSTTPLQGGASESSAVTVPDTVPTATSVSVTPSTPSSADTLTCDYTYFDVDTDPETSATTFRWFIGTTEVLGITTETTTTAALGAVAADEIDCEVTPGNDAGSGAARKASDDTDTAIVNTPGSFTTGPSVSIDGSGQTTDSLTCVWTFADSVDSDPQAVAQVDWYVNASLVVPETEYITGTTSTASVTARDLLAAVDDTVYCSVTASDVSDTVDTVTADSSASLITIVDTEPVATFAAVVDTASTPTVTDTLTCTYTYTDEDNVTDSLVNTDSASVISWIVGTTTRPHTGATAVMGSDLLAVKADAVKCSVTPGNSSGSGSALESSSVTVKNASPDTPGTPVLSVSGGLDGTATCSGWTFSDNDTGDLQGAATVSWFKNGSTSASVTSSVSGAATTSDISLSSTTGGDLNGMGDGDTLACAVKVKDDDSIPLESGISATSSTVALANTAPSVTVDAVVLTGAADGGATCSWTFSDPDTADTQSSATVNWYYHDPSSSYPGTPNYTDTLTTQTSSVITLSADGTTGDIVSVSGAGSLKCAVTVADSNSTDSLEVESAEATIANSVPTIHQSASQSTLGPFVTPAPIATGDTVTCVAFIEELDIESTSWSMAWTDSGGTALSGGGGSATNSGTVSAGTVSTSTATISRTVSSSIDNYYCTVIVTDTAGSVTVSDSVSRSNTAPDQPTVALSSSAPQVDESVTCTWTYSDSDSDAQSGTVVAWLVDGTTQTSSTFSGATLTDSQTMRSINAFKGDDVVCVVTPSDGVDPGTAGSSSTATVANTAPVASAVGVTSATPKVNDPISCDYTWTDADDTGGTIDTDTSTSFAWFVGGTTVGAVTTETTTVAALGADHITAGDVITCEVTPNDGVNAGTAVLGSSATVANSPPVATASIPAGTYTTGTTVTCNVSGQDDNAHIVSGSVEFFIDSVSVGTTALTDFTGGSGTATSGSASYTLVPADGGKQISCTATYTDAIGGTDFDTATTNSTNTVPTVSLTSLTPTAAVGDTLTCVTDVADLDAQTVTISREWRSASDTGTVVQTDSSVTWSSPGGSSALTAVTGTYVVDPTDVLTDVYCVVTADDGTASATANSSVSVANTAPTVVAVVSSSTGTASSGATLTCTGTASDPDAQTLNYSIAWTDGSTSLSTSTVTSGTVAAPTGGTFTGTYVVQPADVAGGSVVCEITLYDVTSSVTVTDSDSLLTSNTVPTLTGVPTLSPTPPTVAAPVSCSAAGSDIDGDTINYGFEWTYDGTALSTLASSGTSTAASLDLTTGAFSKSKTLRCTVTPSDADGIGSPDNVEVSIANAPPSLSVASESSTDADLYVSSTIDLSYATADWVDADSSDPKNLRYVIGRQAGGSGSTATFVTGTISAGTLTASEPLSGLGLTKGDVLFFDYTPYDGTVTGTGPAQTSLTVANMPPTAPTTVSLIPVVNSAYSSAAGSVARAGKDDIVCTGGGSVDSDAADTLTYAYAFYKDDGDGLFDSAVDELVDPTHVTEDGVTGTMDGPAVGTTASDIFWCSVVATDSEDDSTSLEGSHEIGEDCDVDEDTFVSDSITCGGDDCDDGNASINPDADERSIETQVGDGIDQDCDDHDECYNDFDGDTYPAALDADPYVTAAGTGCNGTTELTAAVGFGRDKDCDDNQSRVNPGSDEVACDGLDNDCSSDGVPDLEETDQDLDGFVPCSPIEDDACDSYVSFNEMNEAANWSTTWFGDVSVLGGCDCNDSDTDANAALQTPGVAEVCELVDPQIDSDCDGDDNTSSGIPIEGTSVYYKDKDGDGFGYALDFGSFCNQPDTHSSNKEDCDDQDKYINPLVDEICNDTDDDCDGQVDNDDYQDLGDASGCLDLFLDSDRDLWGDEENIVCLCPTADGGQDTGEDSNLIMVELGSDQYISRQGDCYDLAPDIFPDSGDDDDLKNYQGSSVVDYNESFDSIAARRTEVMDGHDNNCDGYVPLIELDCDSDGSFVKLPTSSFPDEVTRYDEVGLAPCWDTISGLDAEAPQLGADGEAMDLPTVNCAGQNLVLVCDPYTRLWVVGRAGLDDFTGGFRENRPGNVADGDCDDICPDRFPGNTETCDGLDNDCSDYAPDSDDTTPYYSDPYNPDLPERLWEGMDRDGVPDGMDAEIERIGTVTVEEFDLDQDGYIGCGSDIGSLREQVIPTSLSCTIDGFDLEYDEEQKEDCNNTCALTTPVAVEACNGFADTCVGDTEGLDGDADDAIACGIGSLNSGAALQEEVFVLTYFQEMEEDLSEGIPGPDDLNSQPQGGSGAVDSGWFLESRRGNFDIVECDLQLMSESLAVKDVSALVPMLLPRAVPPSDIEDWELGPDDIVATDQLLKQHLNALVGDESVDQAVRELDDRLAGRLNDRDPLLDFCACVNGFESGERDCDEWGERGHCAVLKVNLSATADEEIDLEVEDNGCIAGYPEQVVTRAVWNPVRIQESRQRVVEWECLQLYGKTCSEIAATGRPDTINFGGAPEDCNNLVDDDGDGLVDCDDPECTASTCINTELGSTPSTDWWLELGRHNVSVVTQGNLMGCWGDPTAGIEQIDASTGGDCDNAEPLATRYNPEGPGDLYGRFWDMELDCSTCLDGVDNNCDGQTDCADPGCAACFVGQGFGVGGGSEASCAQLGCSSTGLSRSQTLGGLALAFLALGLVGGGRRRRRSAV